MSSEPATRSPSTTRLARAEQLGAAAKAVHRGLFITAPETIEVREDELAAEHFAGGHVITASLGNCRCASDEKAIRQFTAHARVPNDGRPVAVGHETVQMVLAAPEGSGVTVGDLVLVTPGHSAEPVDPSTFERDPANGVLPSLGYSYRHLGGLRQFNAIPMEAFPFVRDQGFGKLLQTLPDHAEISLASLAHAEPFACNYGTNAFMYRVVDGDFAFDVPPRARIAYLGGTARMAMINLTIVAARPDAELPVLVAITGSQRKLDELTDFALIRDLRARGTEVRLIDRNAPDVVERLREGGELDVIWTNYASQALYDQATATIARGGVINNYAGASDPELVLRMRIAPAPADRDPASWIRDLHHQFAPTDPKRRFGLADEPVIALLGFDADRAAVWRQALPEDARILEALPEDAIATDVFIAGSGSAAADAYAACELKLARGAAVAFVDGDTEIAIRSRHSHYTTRHAICGPNVPWYMTNTSEPLAEHMAIQGAEPVDFDWMVRGTAGLAHAPELMHDVADRGLFGSYFVFTELPELPYVEVAAEAFRRAAEESSGPTAAALRAGAEVLAANGGVWSRAVERALYHGHGLPHPLDLA